MPVIAEKAEITEEILRAVDENFLIEDIDLEGSRIVVFPKESDEVSFNSLFSELSRFGIYPFYRIEKGKRVIRVVKAIERRKKLSAFLHLVLIILTFITVTWAAYIWWAGRDIGNSMIFAIAVMLILGSHELGHALIARKRGIDATLPFFIPVPPIFPFGTLGAVIFMNSPTPDRKALFDVGIAGPITGFIISLPVIIIGISLSKYLPFSPSVHARGFLLGTPPIFNLFSDFILGMPESRLMVLDAHPLAIAGWLGLFVTVLNLFPVGQLDGGHVIRSIFPRFYKTLYLSAVLVLILLSRFWDGWLFWAMITILLTKLEHPGPLNDISELDSKRKAFAVILLAVFLLSFTASPVIIMR